MNFTLRSINNEVLQGRCVCLVRAFSIRLGHQQLAGYKCSPKIEWLESNYPSFLPVEPCQGRTQSCLPALSGSQDSKYIIWRKQTTEPQMFRWSGSMVWKEEALVQTQHLTLFYILPLPASVSTPSLLWASASHLLVGDHNTNRWAIGSFLMRWCIWKSFENYNDYGDDDNNNKVNWHLLSAYHEKCPLVGV